MPLPAEALAHLTRTEAQAATAFSRGVAGMSLEASLAALERPLGARPLVHPVPLELWPPGSLRARPDPDLVAVVIGDEVGRARLVLELDPALAGFLVDRALGAGAPEPRLCPGPVSDGERGTLGYLAALALAPTGGRYRVLGVVSTLAALTHALGGAEGLVFAHAARVELAGLPGWARLFVEARHAAGSGAGGAVDATLPLELAVVAGTARLPAAEVAALGPGDVLIPDAWSARAEAGRWQGEARAEAGDGALLVLALGEACSLSRREAAVPRAAAVVGARNEVEMSDAGEVGDVPVEVAIEVGRVMLTVGELAALGPGAVLGTALPVGPVVLRVGPRVVARGELAVVEGELGVRIVERC